MGTKGKLMVKLMEGAVLPTRGTEQAAGLDLYALEDFEIPACRVYGQAAKVGTYHARTGVIVAIPEGYEGMVRPRSGLAFKENISVFMGTIDADYRSELNVLMYNFGFKSVSIAKGQRIAQLVISPVAMLEPEESKTPLTETKRGEGGLGHTGR